MKQFMPVLCFFFESIYNNEMIRLVGVSSNNVISKKNLEEQISLFNYEDTHYFVKKNNQVDEIIQQLNQSLSKGKVIKASSLINEKTIQKKYLENSE